MSTFSEDDGPPVADERPRHVVFVDEFLRQVFQSLKLTEFRMITNPGLQPEVCIKGTDPHTEEPFEYWGHGSTIGHCLRDILDQIIESFSPTNEVETENDNDS